MSADFEAFTRESGKVQDHINHYNIERNPCLLYTSQSDFASYHEYAEAKKEFEMVQFFTPHEICRDMVDMLYPVSSEMVLDMCCGMGNFFNHLPNPHNAYGFDIDGKAVSVARYLYPDCLLYTSPIGFGILIGNIPFKDAGLQVGIYEQGSVLNILYQGVTSGWYPPLIFRCV